MTTHNIHTLNNAVFVVTIVAGLAVDFMRLLVSVIHKRDFMSFTTYRFTCIVFQLCRDAGFPICHRDVLRTPTGIVDIGLIRNEDNEAAPQ